MPPRSRRREPPSLPARFAWLSVATALATLLLKAVAYAWTGSVGLLSDALESLVNLAAGLMALAMLSIAARPADEEHPYGHGKAEYFSSGVEGTLIVLAAVGIAVAAVERLLNPCSLERLGQGLAVSLAATALNLGAALVLRRAGRAHDSIALEADAEHLLTDVWSSAAVLAGVGAVAVTGWQPLDPIVALGAAGLILRSGGRIVRRSISGFMDAGLPQEEQEKLLAALAPYRAQGVEFHALRTRQAGARRFVSFHVLVPGGWTVRRGHELLESIESDVRGALPQVTVFTHLEALEDPAAWEDTGLDRAAAREETAP